MKEMHPGSAGLPGVVLWEVEFCRWVLEFKRPQWAEAVVIYHQIRIPQWWETELEWERAGLLQTLPWGRLVARVRHPVGPGKLA